MSAFHLPADGALHPPDRVSGSPSGLRTPTALDGACSVFDFFGAGDMLMAAAAKNLEPYEVVAAHAWQRVGDSMRAVIDARSSSGRAQ